DVVTNCQSMTLAWRSADATRASTKRRRVSPPREQQPAMERLPGLCSDCTWAQRIDTSRGSAFLKCERSTSDARFPKYPQLPVFTCDGYERSVRDPLDPSSH